MTPVGEVSSQEDNLKANDKDSMGTSPGMIAQSRCKKSNQAGNCLFLIFIMTSSWWVQKK